MEHFEATVKVIDSIDMGDKMKIEIQFLPKAQQTIIDNLQHRFRNMWDDIGMLLSMINLEYSKSESKGDEKKWRPMGKSAEEQVRPFVSKKLLEVRKILQKQIDTQTRIIEQLFHEVDCNRGTLKHQIEEMENVVSMINNNNENLQATDENIKLFLNNAALDK